MEGRGDIGGRTLAGIQIITGSWDYYRSLGMVYVMGVGGMKHLPFYFHVLGEVIRIFHEPKSE